MRWRSLVQDVLGVRAVRSGLWRSARQLSISLRRYRRLEDEAHEVRERLERNILRAGLRLMKGDRAALEENVRQRAVSVDLEKLYQLQSEYFGLNGHLQTLRQQRNINIHAQSKDQKSVLERAMYPLVSLLPNTSHPLSPVGGYENVKVIRTHGNKPVFDFPVRSHVDIAESLGLVDFSSAAKASGRRFYYLTGAAALLELALVQYAMHKACGKGFSPVITPDIVRTGVVEGCGFHPRGEATQVYALHHHHGHLSLSGTAEVPLAGMFIEKTLTVDQLPVRLVAFGRSYRAESGGAGRAVKGLYRVHQFSKVELFAVTETDEGDGGEGGVLDEMVALQEEICADLGLHYRVLEMPTGELGGPAHRKLDVEVWMPGRAEFGEVCSASDCGSFQSQRLGIRTVDRGERSYAHTLNATACAVPRTIIAILENHQMKDGSVVVPPVLHPYLPPDCHHIM
ncbi:Serine--tRNA ligase, mitochondrial [Geodia barretti]|uniref:serine--tRNA ligase n=1 Tax=Geodia barretti TaxID=519541 RepID=A0AA35XDK0_GEOBA|nr:Serine--tRNA ligase, mitochondrial [Geodia barretti]